MLIATPSPDPPALQVVAGDADYLASGVQRRTAGVAMVDLCVGLQVVPRIADTMPLVTVSGSPNGEP